MKAFEELTQEELAGLTNQDIEHYVALEMAQKGIRFIECPKEPPKAVIPDEIKTKVYSFGDIHSTNKELIEKIESLCKGENFVKIEYDWQRNPNEKQYLPLEDWQKFEIKETLCNSPQHYSAFKTQLEQYKLKKEAFDKALKEYKEHQPQINQIREKIVQEVNNAYGKEEQFRKYVSEYKRYITLAENNQEIAEKFFKNAYTVDDLTLLMIQEKANSVAGIAGIMTGLAAIGFESAKKT